MSAHRVRHDPTGLTAVLATLDGPEHAGVRAEVFAREPGPALVLVRCRCGRLFEPSALEDHLLNPTTTHRATARRAGAARVALSTRPAG